MEHIRKSSYTYDDLISCSKGEMYGPGNAQLPAPPMLMFDRMTHVSKTGGKFDKGEMRAELDIKKDLWFFGCHFINDPVMPGCLGLDAMWQLIGFYLAWLGSEGRGRALGAGDVKFTGQITPENKKVVYQIDFKRIIQRKLVMGIADGMVLVDGKVIYEGQDLKVGLFHPDQM